MTRRVDWKLGDVFLIPVSNGTFAAAQIIGREASVLNSISIALFDRRLDQHEEPSPILEFHEVYATLFVTRDLLDRGKWPVVGNHPITIPAAAFPYEDRRSTGYIGAKVIGSGIVQHFVSAFFGAEAWSQYKDPEYFDKLLLAPSKKLNQVSAPDEGMPN